MAFQFPDNPNLGDKYQDYTWVGSYWSRIAAAIEETPATASCDAGTFSQTPTASPIEGHNNTLINLTIPIDLGQLLNKDHHVHSDFDYLAPE